MSISNAMTPRNLGIASIAAVVVLCAGAAVPAQAASIQGVWKISKPTVEVKPVSGEVPFTAEGREHYENNLKLRAAKKFDDYDITLSRCSSPGVPRLALTPMRFKIWEQFGATSFDYEWNRANRFVDTSGQKLEQSLVPNFTGTSSGHWESNTFVAVTTDLSDRTLIDDILPHTLDMKVTERYRLLNPNTLEDRVTINDPEYYSHPWDFVVTYKRQPDAVFPEDVCLDRLKAGQPVFPKS